jgi:hypothetical protein
MEILQPPEELELWWSRHEYLYESETTEEVRKGNFSQEETIQITAPESEIFYFP